MYYMKMEITHFRIDTPKAVEWLCSSVRCDCATYIFDTSSIWTILFGHCYLSFNLCAHTVHIWNVLGRMQIFEFDWKWKYRTVNNNNKIRNVFNMKKNLFLIQIENGQVEWVYVGKWNWKLTWWIDFILWYKNRQQQRINFGRQQRREREVNLHKTWNTKILCPSQAIDFVGFLSSSHILCA